MKIKPAAVTFLTNKSVSAWQPILSFPETHVTKGAGVDWNTNQVLVRLRLRANQNEEGSRPVLLLEALVLNSGTWDGVPETKRMSLSGDGSLAIMLWSADCAWYSPLPHHKLPTAPGILRLSMDVPLPSEFRYRWFLQAILRRMDKGKSADSKQEFEAYMEKPFLTPNPGTTYCWLPNICSMAADGVDTSGMSLSSHQFIKKGRVMCRNNPKPYNSLKINPPCEATFIELVLAQGAIQY